jgi:hypothetical protein
MIEYRAQWMTLDFRPLRFWAMWSARTLCRVLFASSELVLAELHLGAECRVLDADNVMTHPRRTNHGKELT